MARSTPRRPRDVRQVGPSDFWHKVDPKKKNTKKGKKVVGGPLGDMLDMRSLALNSVGQGEDINDLWITIDSGASENMISDRMARPAKARS